MSLPIFNERAQAILMHECLDLQRFEEIQKQYYAINKHSLENRQYQHFFKFGDYVIYAKWINEILQHTSNRRSGDLENQIEKILQATYPSFDIEANGDLIPKIIKSSQITSVRQCNPTIISESDISVIRSMVDENGEFDEVSARLYFAMLVYARYNRANPIAYTEQKNEETHYTDSRLRIKIGTQLEYSDLIKYAGIKFSQSLKKEDPYIKYRCLYRMYQNYNVISGSMKPRNTSIGTPTTMTFILEKAEPLPEKHSDKDVVIKDYTDIDSYFQYITGNSKYKICNQCGDIFKTNSTEQICCNKCLANDKAKQVLLFSDDINQTRICKCFDCGNEFFVGYNNHTTSRCAICTEKRKKFIRTKKYKEATS